MQVVQFALKKKRRKTTVQLKIVQDEIVVFFLCKSDLLYASPLFSTNLSFLLHALNQPTPKVKSVTKKKIFDSSPIDSNTP